MNSSESLKEISAALVSFQMESHGLSKDASNPFFKSKYITLDSIIDYSRPLLAKHGLCILQCSVSNEGKTGVVTRLIHKSGEWLESEPVYITPVKNDPQSIGSAITYARRYSLAAFLYINSEEDDDGEKAMGREASKKPDNSPSNEPKPQSNSNPQPTSGNLSEKQIKRLYGVAYGKGIDKTGVDKLLLKKYKINKPSELTKQQYDEVIGNIEQNAESIKEWLKK